MCHSITYYFSECLCTYRIGWYTCHQARLYLLSTPSHTDKTIDVADSEVSTLLLRHPPVRENCARFNYTTQMKKSGDARCVECVSSEGGPDGDADSAEGNVGSASEDDDGDGVLVPPLQLQGGKSSRKESKGKETAEERLAKLGILPDGHVAAVIVKKDDSGGNTKTETGAERKAEIQELASIEVKPLTVSKKLGASDLKSKHSNANADKTTGSVTPELSLNINTQGNVESRPCASRVGGGVVVRSTGDPVKKSFTSSIPVRSSSLLAVGAGVAIGAGGSGGGGLPLNMGLALGIKRTKTARGMRVERERQSEREVERSYKGDSEGDTSMGEIERLNYGDGRQE